MKRFEFDLVTWSAWAPDVRTREQWREWARAPCVTTGTEKPAIPFVPAAIRRRCGHQDRMVLEVGSECVRDCREPPAIVLGSRHGEAQSNWLLLELLARREHLSPMKFSLSVHNASMGLLSIATKNPGVSRSIAAGRGTLAAALLEALGLLAEHAQVLLLLADELPPAEHWPYLDEGPAVYALGLLLAQGRGFEIEVTRGRTVPNELPALPLPHPLELAAWLARECIEDFEMRALNLAFTLRARLP